MDAIAIRCKKCQHGMKFSAEKAGKKTKCPKCEEINVIQAVEESIEAAKPEPAPTPAPPPPVDPFEDDGPASYGVYLDPELEERRKQLAAEEEAAGKKKKKSNKDLPKVTRKMKALPDAAAWTMVRWGMLPIFVAVWIWLGCHILQGAYVLIGSVEFPEFAALMVRNLEVRDNDGLPPPGQGWAIDELELYLGMIGGKDFTGFARFCLTVSTIFYLFQAVLCGLGYICCVPVPRRFGMFNLVLLMLGLAVFNFLIWFIFKLLPVTGIHGYVMIPFLVPEIAMTEYNMERLVPIHVLWSGAPFWENTLNLIFKFLIYLEPTILSAFIWYAGIVIKDESIENGGKGRVQMALGTFFIIVCFHLFSLAGASPVMVLLMRVVYTLWYFFLIIFLLQLAMLLLRFRAVLYDKIHPKNELESKAKDEDEEEEDEDEEDEEEEREEDDEDEEDQDEDEEEDEPPRKKKKQRK